MPATATPRLDPLDPTELGPVLGDLGLDASAFGAGGGSLALAVAPGGPDPAAAGPELARRAQAELAHDGTLLLLLEATRPDPELARWRDALWPALHVVALYRVARLTIERQTLSGSETLAWKGGRRGTLLVARPRTYVQSPDATVEKFDANAGGWNGQPGSPGYPHYRWMRRHVGTFVDPRGARRILDFGCGAGWCGIEAALRAPGAALCAFDPSPAMVEQAERNAREAGVADFTGRTGFGEDPPFPGPGEEPFDLVISSGVVSFSPDRERWLDGLARTVAPGGRLVVGDIHRASRGMRARRARKPLLPVRELNASTRAEVRAALERRGFEHLHSGAYQLTWPVPEALHLNETRLKGALTWPLLALNRATTALDRALGSPLQPQFDSWVLALRAPR